MYNTVKEMHLAIDMGLQHINSNRKQSIPADWKDMALNYAVLQFIENRTSPKSNRKQEGLEDTQKRYDDLKDLKKNNKSIAYTNDDGIVFSVLPKDYYKLISLGAKVKYSKFDLPSPDEVSNINVKVLSFPDDLTNNEVYKNLIIRRKNQSNTYTNLFEASKHNVTKLYGRDSKFILINLVLEELNNITGYDVYWESYHNITFKDSFIIVSNSNSKYYLKYDTLDSTNDYWIESTNTASTYNHYEIQGEYKACNLVSSEDEFNVEDNYYTKRNGHLKPNAYLNAGTIYLQEGDNYVITETNLVYYKKPKLINYRTNTACEIQVNREIVDLAVQRLKAYIKDEGYQHIVNENQIIE